MSRLHESQDGLFYSTTPLDMNQLWILGFVCKSCRFVQMGEDRLNRHLASHPDCHGYVKVSLIDVLEKGSKSLADEAFTTDEQKAIFICAALDKTRTDRSGNADDSGDLNRNGVQSSIALIQTLAAKVISLPVEEVSSSSNQTSNTVPSVAPVDQQHSSVKTPIERKTADPIQIGDLFRIKSLSADMDLMQSEDAVKENVGPSEAWKSNSWLGSTIAKLADKLGPLSELNVSTSSGESEGEPQALMDVDEDGRSDLSMAESASTADSSITEIVEDEEENGAKDRDNEKGFLHIESVVSLPELSANDSLDPDFSPILHSSVTLRKDAVTFPYSTPHKRHELAALLKEEQTYRIMLDRSRLRNCFKCMAHRCTFTSNLFTDFIQVSHSLSVNYRSDRTDFNAPHNQFVFPALALAQKAVSATESRRTSP